MSTEQTTLFDAVDVHLDEGPGDPVLVGHLRASFAGSRRLGGSSFEYAASYLASSARYAISPDLPLVAGRQYSGDEAALFGAFADATPDDWGIGLIDAAYAQEYAVRRARNAAQPLAISEFDHLVQQNDLTRLGALRFTAPRAQTTPRGQTETSTPEQAGAPIEWLTAARHTAANPNDTRRIAEAVARFEEYEATEEDMEILGDAGSSLGGARPKVTIEEEDGSLWLLKLPSNRDRRVDLEAWEATALDLAEKAGLRVPHRRLIRLDEHKSSLLIERFDRADEHGAGQHRVGYMSAMTAMQLSPQNPSNYENFADTIDQVTLAASTEDLREMFGRVALTVLVGNVDDHWKNHGFRRERVGAGTNTESSWRLSPLFDVNPTKAGSRVRSRQINSQDDPSNRDMRLLIEGRDVYKLTAQDASEVLSRVARAVGAWRETAQKHGIRDGEIEHMASAFNEAQLEHAERFVAEHADSAPSTAGTKGAGQDLTDRKRRFPELFTSGAHETASKPEQGSELGQ